MTIRRLKELVDPHRPITYGIVQAGEDVPDGVPYIRPIDMDEREGVRDPTSLLRTSRAIAEAYRRSTVRAGDLVVSIGPSFGKVMIIPEDLDGANLTQGTARVALREWVDRRYLYWALQSSEVVAFWESSIGGATFHALNLGPLRETPVSVREPGEQRAVADYLDAETARIDAIVARRRAADALIAKRREAVVAKEFDAARQRNGVIPLRRLAKDLVVGVVVRPATLYAESGRPFLRGQNLSSQGVTDENLRYISDADNHAHPNSVLRDGDVLVSRVGLTGQAAVVPQWAVGGNCVGMLIVRCGRLLSPVYAALAINAPDGQRQLEGLAGGSVQDVLNASALGTLVVPNLPVQAQEALVARLAPVLTAHDEARAAIARHVALLQERHQAVITAAVTGQLEIPGVAA